ncbi:MAG: hypothetical protein HY905_19440 [Deltaproteobacteria bacterium]|nr:hypothetical protein [Deltaproteobacteria bacterium]
MSPDRDRDGEREPRSSRDRDVSWSEIDKKRDQSRHVGGDARRDRKPRGSSVTSVGRYKSDLSRLFERGEAGKLVKGVAKQAGLDVSGGLPERQQALRAILDAPDPATAQKAVDAFSREHGELPDDPEVLCQALLHTDEAVVLDVLQRLHRYLAGHVVSRKTLLIQRTKQIELGAESDELREAASRVRDLLGG